MAANVRQSLAPLTLPQSQGVLSERLRSFSMQDLSSYESEPSDAVPGATQPAPAQHRVKPMTRSKSESSKGESHLSSAVEARWMPSALIKLSELCKTHPNTHFGLRAMPVLQRGRENVKRAVCSRRTFAVTIIRIQSLWQCTVSFVWNRLSCRFLSSCSSLFKLTDIVPYLCWPHNLGPAFLFGAARASHGCQAKPSCDKSHM